MTVREKNLAREIGEAFAIRAREEPIARELWVTVEEYGVHLWLLIDPIGDDDRELDLYGLVEVLDDQFPEADYLLHLLNPRDYVGDLRDSLRHDAEQISLRAN